MKFKSSSVFIILSAILLTSLDQMRAEEDVKGGDLLAVASGNNDTSFKYPFAIPFQLNQPVFGYPSPIATIAPATVSTTINNSENISNSNSNNSSNNNYNAFAGIFSDESFRSIQQRHVDQMKVLFPQVFAQNNNNNNNNNNSYQLPHVIPFPIPTSQYTPSSSSNSVQATVTVNSSRPTNDINSDNWVNPFLSPAGQQVLFAMNSLNQQSISNSNSNNNNDKNNNNNNINNNNNHNSNGDISTSGSNSANKNHLPADGKATIEMYNLMSIQRGRALPLDAMEMDMDGMDGGQGAMDGQGQGAMDPGANSIPGSLNYGGSSPQAAYGMSAINGMNGYGNSMSPGLPFGQGNAYGGAGGGSFGGMASAPSQPFGSMLSPFFGGQTRLSFAGPFG